MTIMVFILGLCVGSFINMLVYRTAVSYKVIKLKSFKVKDKNRSYCDFCGRQLKWYENVPVISWLILKGKTKCCRKKLPIEYPLIEIGTAVLFLISQNNWLLMIILALLIFETVFDLKYMILPDFATYILIGISAIFFHNWSSGLGACLFLLVLHLVTKGKGMGLGDVKLAVFMGLYLGWPNIVVAFYIAFISGAVIGIMLIITKKLKRTSEIPFGPFLIGGTILAQWYGNGLLYYVSRWF